MSEVETNPIPFFLEKQNEGLGIDLFSSSFWMFSKGGYGSITAGSRFNVAVNLTTNPAAAYTRPSVASLEAEFNTLVTKWDEDTFSTSSLTKIYAHPAYQRIIGMGTKGIGFVLKELQKGQGHWLYALKYMAGENVSAGMDNFEDAKAAWLEWGYKHNYI